MLEVDMITKVEEDEGIEDEAVAEVKEEDEVDAGGEDMVGIGTMMVGRTTPPLPPLPPLPLSSLS